jgi:hypothetical protein
LPRETRSEPIEAQLFSRSSPILSRRNPILDTHQGPGYPHFVRGRIDSVAEAGAFLPPEKRDFGSLILCGSQN